jgi:hypothetical protein
MALPSTQTKGRQLPYFGGDTPGHNTHWMTLSTVSSWLPAADAEAW